MKPAPTIPLALLCLLLGAVRPANATLVTIYIEGVVDSVHDYGNYLEGKVNVGDPITGYYTYDTATPDTNPSEWIGDYWHYSPPAGILLTTGGFEFETDPGHVQFLLSVGNAGGPYSMDNYLVRSYGNLPLSNGVALSTISWQLDDSTGTALDSDAIPMGPPDLTEWEVYPSLCLEADRMYVVRGHITQAIPEPATLSLIALGAFGLAARKTRKS